MFYIIIVISIRAKSVNESKTNRSEDRIKPSLSQRQFSPVQLNESMQSNGGSKSPALLTKSMPATTLKSRLLSFSKLSSTVANVS